MRAFILFVLFFSTSVSAQVGTGQWRLHVPNRLAIDVTMSQGLVFAAFENGMLEFDPSAEETSLWTDVNGLSDVRLTALGRNLSGSAVYVGYENGNIDKLSNNTVVNIPAIRLAEIEGSKRINRIVPYQNNIYFATGFSIVVVDPQKDEVKDTYYPTSENAAVLDVAFVGDTIYALTATRLLKASMNNIALADPSQWVVDSRLDVLTVNSYTHLEAVNNELYALFQHDAYGQDSVFRIAYSGNTLVNTEPFSLQINSITNNGTQLILNSDGAIYRYNADLTLAASVSSYWLYTWYTPMNSFYDNGTYWVADHDKGLRKVTEQNTIRNIEFSGPPKSDYYSMDWEKGKMAVAGGGLSSAASQFSSSGVYTFEDENWSLYDRDNMQLWSGKNVWDFLTVSIDPTNPERIAVGTFSEIPLSIIMGGQVTDTFTPLNSTLKTSEVTTVVSAVTSVKYDENGDLWVLNGYSDKPLNLYSNGSWYAFDCGMSAKNQLSRKLVIDYNGNKWFSMVDGSLFGYNDGGTPTVSSDDKIVNLNSGEYSGALPSNSVTAIAVDFDNEIWIGTDNGFAVLYNSESSFDAGAGDYNAQRIKVEFEGNVEYVLGNTHITDIEVDGGNRKWFGTASSGIILLSADGLEVIQQFTTENSPLISNNIIDLKLDHSTGELFIITDKGLISYRTDATYEDPEYTDVKVFPNPAHPDFDGPITIQGIRYNSDVKITDVAGNLVYQTTSNGGTATWNGRTLTGEKVTTGVYLIWTAANEGKGRKVGKVLVVH